MEHLVPFPISASTYSNHGCRCAGCCRANTLRCQAYRRRPSARRRRALRWALKGQ